MKRKDIEKEIELFRRQITHLQTALAIVSEDDSKRDIMNHIQYKTGRLHAYESICLTEDDD